MKLFFDARYIRTDFHDGISRYSTELGNALAQVTPVTFMIHDKAQIKFLPDNAEYIIIHSPTSAKEIFTSLILNKYNPDVVYSPMQTMGSFGRNFKLVLTLHDMIYYRHRTPPTQFNPIIRAVWWLYHSSYIPQRITLNRADIVATVSETSQKDILKARLTKRPTTVIHNAPQKLDELISASVIQDIKGPRNLVYMGSFMPYKNVETLIDSLKWLPGYTLHLLSRISKKRQSELMENIPKGSNVIFHDGVTDKQYATLLADNAILVTASRDEGYGLPIAEALAIGVPAVVSDLPVFHEVAGDGALYASPDKPKEFAEQILSLNDTKIHDNIVKKGLEHIEKFQWPKSAQKLFESIQNKPKKIPSSFT
jgi:glycosyltransferase involved in cell wall biosynthesis